MERAVQTHKKELHQAQLRVAHFLNQNNFKVDVNCKRAGVWCWTYPLHEAVKQKDPYLTSKLLMFGAKPWMRDWRGRIAFDYAKKAKDQEVMKVFEQCGYAPHSPTWSSGVLQRYPPPTGFEAFFASVAKDPSVVANSEAKWFQQLGCRRLRSSP